LNNEKQFSNLERKSPEYGAKVKREKKIRKMQSGSEISMSD
jgi:hypothetical protein